MTDESASLPDPGWCQELAIENAPDLLVVVDPDLRPVWTNGAVARTLGLGPGEMLGTPVQDHIHPDDLGHAVGALGEAQRSDGYHVATRIRVRRSDGTYVDTRVTSTTITRADGTWMVLALRPVEDEIAIERRRVQLKALAQSVYVTCAGMHWYQEEDRVAAMLGGLAAVVGARSVELAATDQDGRGAVDTAAGTGTREAGTDGTEHMVVTAAWSRPDAGQRRAPLGSRFAVVADPDRLRLAPCVLTQLADSGTAHHRLGSEGVVVEIWLEGAGGQASGARQQGVARLGFDGISPDWDDANADIVALMCSTLIATMQRCDQERDVNRAAMLDPLTRLLNRSALHDRLGALLGDERGDGPRPVVLFADLNHFKQLNDRFGHREGDQVLQTVAEAITSQVRSNDLAARIGGDEFVVVFDAPEESAGALVARVRGAIDRALSRWPAVSIAVGAISVGPHGTPDDVLERADLAMYRDKATSRPATARRDASVGSRGSP